MLIPIQTMLQGRYQIIRMIAQGGIGAVYEAFDTRLQGRVAIKQLMYSGAAGLQTFEREARMMNSLRHPGLARVSDYFSEATNQFLVMDYIEGNDLAEMLAQRGTAFDVPVVLDWMHQLLMIITYLHNHKPEVLHRDIKPNNIKIAANNHLMLIDFGLSKGHTATQNFSIMGYTPHYAPLEQIQGTGTDPRSDIYAIGATIYHLLTNHPPSDSLTRASSIIRSQPDPLIPPIQLNAGIPSDLNMMILHMLAQDPDRRPDSATTINRTVQTIQRSLAATAPTLVNQPGNVATSTQPTIHMSSTAHVPAGANASSTLTATPQITLGKARKSQTKKHPWLTIGAILVMLAVAGVFLVPQLITFKVDTALTPTVGQLSDQNPPTESTDTTTVAATMDSNIQVSLKKEFSGTAAYSQLGIQYIQWSNDGEYFVAAGVDFTLWDKNGNLIRNISEDMPSLNKGTPIAWNPNNRIVAVGASDSIGLWGVDGVLKKLMTVETTTTILEWNPDGSLLASGIYNGKVQLWNAEGDMLYQWQASYGVEEINPVTDIAWHPAGNIFVTSTRDGSVRSWSKDGSVSGDIQLGNEVYDLDWNSKGDILAILEKDFIGFRSEDAQFTTVPINTTSHSIEWNIDNIIAIPANPARLFYGSDLWHLENGEKVLLENSETMNFSWSPNGKMLAVIDYGNFDLRLFDNQGNLIYILSAIPDIYSVDWNNDGTRIVIGLSTDAVEIWSVIYQ